MIPNRPSCQCAGLGVVASVHTGVLIEVTATSMPASSRNESVLARDQGGGAMPPTGWSPSLVAPPEKIGQHMVVDVHGEGHGSLVSVVICTASAG